MDAEEGVFELALSRLFSRLFGPFLFHGILGMVNCGDWASALLPRPLWMGSEVAEIGSSDACGQVADRSIDCGPSSPCRFHRLGGKLGDVMTRIVTTWECLECHKLMDRTHFIGVKSEREALMDLNPVVCRSCGSGSLRFGTSSAEPRWEGGFLIAFEEEPA